LCLPLGIRVFLVLGTEPLVGPGDVDDIGEGEAGDEAAKINEGMTLHRGLFISSPLSEPFISELFLNMRSLCHGKHH